jgi:hypothetical protein
VRSGRLIFALDATASRTMARVDCRTGPTQIARVLAHAQRETLEAKVGAVVFVGDACEPVGDDLDRLGASASALGKLRTPVFAFQEGCEPSAEKAFRKIAEWSGGAYERFDAASQGGRAVRGGRDDGLGRPEGRRQQAAARSNEEVTDVERQYFCVFVVRYWKKRLLGEGKSR